MPWKSAEGRSKLGLRESAREGSARYGDWWGRGGGDWGGVIVDGGGDGRHPGRLLLGLRLTGLK